MKKYNFEDLKNRYIIAFNKCNKSKNIIRLTYGSGWVTLETDCLIGAKKYRCEKFEKMVLTLEERLNVL